jgi:hypothetical protein
LELIILYNGQVHEDSFILYSYVKNFVDGLGIVYYPGGPPTEGVTDFLWMFVLLVISSFNIDPAISALFPSSFGIFTIVLVLLNNYLEREINFNAIFVSILISILVIISPFTTASLAGFSTLFYISFVALLLEFYWNGTDVQKLKIPFLALLLSLIRPEGIIIGLAFTIVTAIELNDKLTSRRFVRHSIIAVFLGLIYFLWRWYYFGSFLPLPFYVKSDDFSRLIGLKGNISWIKENKFLLLIFVLAIPIFQLKMKKFIRFLIPFFLLFLFLCIIEQTQNIALRYHGPLTFLVMMVFVLFLKEYSKNKSKILTFIISFVLIGFISYPFYRTFNTQLKILRNFDYINYFPYLLSKSGLEPNLIALTEAGRMAYWTNFKIVDLVGLNDAFCALNDIDVNYIDQLNPDIIFIHTANTLFEWDREGNYFTASINEIYSKLIPSYTGIQAKNYSKVEWAVLTVYKFLLEKRDDYNIFFVKFNNEFDHLYAIKRNENVSPEEFKVILEKSFMVRNRKSYLGIKSILKDD